MLTFDRSEVVQICGPAYLTHCNDRQLAGRSLALVKSDGR